MTVKRGFSQEGDELLDYLVRAFQTWRVEFISWRLQEKGTFHALEKQYLRKMIFALYIVRVPYAYAVGLTIP